MSEYHQSAESLLGHGDKKEMSTSEKRKCISCINDVIEEKPRYLNEGNVPETSPIKSVNLCKARETIRSSGEYVIMKKTVGYVEGTALVLGIIVGSGIFVSPAGVTVNCGSVGLSLIVWGLCGAFSALGALSFAELGTTIPRSGGDYLYILEVFGPFWAFMRIWIEILVVRPASNAIVALTLSYYIVQISSADSPALAIRLIAIVAISLLTYINCRSSAAATKVQNVFTIAKVLALVIVIVVGVVQLSQGHFTNFTSEKVWEGSNFDVGRLVLATNAGLWAYSGWNELNYVTDEIKNPSRNLPLSIMTSIFIITVLYVSVNLAYFTVLTPVEIGRSEATAVLFGYLTMGKWSVIIPISVALCCFGGINGSIFTSSRLFYIGACEGHLPSIVGMVNVHKLTPVPSIIVVGVLSCVYMVTDNVFMLITYVNFVYYLAMGFAIVGLIILRFKCPDLDRPLKLPLILHVLSALLCVGTGFFSFVTSPVESGIGALMCFSSVPIYFVFVRAKKPKKITKFYSDVTAFFQCLTLSVVEDIKLNVS